MRNYHLHHPFDKRPAALPWPTDPPETVRKLAALTRCNAKAAMQTPAEPWLRDPGQQATHPFFKPHAPPAPLPPVPPKRARGKRDAPAPNRAGIAVTSRPPAPPPNPPGNSGPSILVILPPIITTAPNGPGILIILPPRHQRRPHPRRTQDSKRARRSSSPSATNTRGTGSGVRAQSHTASATRGTTGGPQIRVFWHCQKELDQGSSAPDKPEGHTLELTSAHPFRLRTDENKAHRGTEYTGELPPEWSQGLPPPRLPERPPPGKKSPGPSSPP